MIYIALYLIAIVAANLSVAQFGPDVTILNAFLFIGLDLTARDHLHEQWQGRALYPRMLGLIAAGSVLSAFLNWNAAPIAIASFCAFLGAGVVDTLIYQELWKRWYPKWLCINGSNLPAAVVDSLLFPALAFGFPLMWGIVLGQFVAKVLGGFVWSLVLNWRQSESVPV